MKKSLGTATLLAPTPVWLVGAYDASGRANAAVIAWGGICCSKPPCVAISLRAATMTHGNIMARRAFTVNIPSEELIAQADYFGIVSGRDVDKFAATGLTAVKSELVDAPYIAEFPLVVECVVLQVVELGLHTQFVGEIKDIKADEAVLAEGGGLDVGKLRPVAFAPSARTYHGLTTSIGPAFSVGRCYAAKKQ
ncbi:MAG: flavin reductase family protein [Desulfovibrionaceae bacterium]|nr:flavin reductase family protein [Desulfovibrionaceae bacterium]